MDKKVLKFQLDKKDIKIKELLNGEFLEMQMDAISDIYPNRNKSHFTLACLQDLVGTVYNKPILGYFDTAKGIMGDFKGHECPNGLRYDPELDNLYYDYTAEGSEIPLGMIRESDTVEVIHNDKTNLNWLRFTCVLWTQYNYKAVKSLLRARNGKSKVSVEVEVLESHYDADGIEIFDKCNLTGVTILGADVMEGIPDAHLNVLEVLDNALFQKKQKALRYAYSALENYNSNIAVETSNEGDNQVEPSQKDSNNEINFSSDTDNGIANENPEEEAIMVNQETQEGGNNEMMTYQERRDALDEYVKANYPNKTENTYIYVTDFTDTEVYYNVWDEDKDIYYKATYALTLDEENHPIITVDFENQIRVVKRWEVYSENTEECPECHSNPCVCNTANQQTNMEDDDDEDDDNDDDNDDNDNDDDRNKANECKFEQDNAPVNTNTEPTTSAGEGMTNEEQVQAAAASIGVPETQTSAEDVGKANSEAVNTLNGNVPDGANPAGVPTINQEVVNDTPVSNEETSKGQNDETATVVSENNEIVKVEQPNDEEKEKLFAGNSTTNAATTAENFYATVEIEGEQYDVNKLFEKYNADMSVFSALKEEMETLKANYSSLQENIKVQEANKLANFGANFINSDNEVDDESKANFANQISEKCKSYEFTTEEEVKKFAKSLLAMYFYEKREQSAGDDVVMPLNQVAVPSVQTASSNKKLNDAFAELEKI